MILRTLYYLACALIFGAIVHIAIILLIPYFGTKDAWTTLSKRAELWSFRKIDSKTHEFPHADPFFQFGTCRFDLTQSGVLIKAPQTNRFWSASVFDEKGNIVYSLTNRSSIDNHLQLLILNPVQMTMLREFQPKIAETAIVIEADIKEGFVILRLFSADSSWQEETDEFLKNVTCEKNLPGQDEAANDNAETDEGVDEDTPEGGNSQSGQ